MTMPGFTAEASLVKTSSRYRSECAWFRRDGGSLASQIVASTPSKGALQAICIGVNRFISAVMRGIGNAAALGTIRSPSRSADQSADGEVEVAGAMSWMDRGYPAGAPVR
jgi:hypothetical protein